MHLEDHTGCFGGYLKNVSHQKPRHFLKVRVKPQCHSLHCLPR